MTWESDWAAGLLRLQEVAEAESVTLVQGQSLAATYVWAAVYRDQGGTVRVVQGDTSTAIDCDRDVTQAALRLVGQNGGSRYARSWIARRGARLTVLNEVVPIVLMAMVALAVLTSDLSAWWLLLALPISGAWVFARSFVAASSYGLQTGNMRVTYQSWRQVPRR